MFFDKTSSKELNIGIVHEASKRLDQRDFFYLKGTKVPVYKFSLKQNFEWITMR